MCYNNHDLRKNEQFQHSATYWLRDMKNRLFFTSNQARFLPAINRWADRYSGWAIVVGGGGGWGCGGSR